MTTVRLRESLNAPCGVLCCLFASALCIHPNYCFCPTDVLSLSDYVLNTNLCVAKTFPSETSPFPLKILPKLPDGFYPLRFLTDISLVKITPSTNPPETSPDLSLDISPHRVATGHFSP